MFLEIGIFILGLVLLSIGAKWLVDGSAKFAATLGIRPIIIGMTVIAFGTSAPEFVFNLASTLKGSNDLGLGNIIGSNIANIALVLGVSAIISPITIDKTIVRKEYPIVLVVSILFYVFALDQVIGMIDGILLSLSFIGVIIYFLNSGTVEELVVDVPTPEEKKDANKTSLKQLGTALLGLITLIVGANFMVDSSISIARDLGLSELVIGLTIVAIGTSLPELAASVVSSKSGESDLTLGNVLGSNIFNILMVIGILSIFVPTQADGSNALLLHFPVMIFLTVLLFPLLQFKKNIGRWDGVLLVLFYIGYLVASYLMQ